MKIKTKLNKLGRYPKKAREFLGYVPLTICLRRSATRVKMFWLQNIENDLRNLQVLLNVRYELQKQNEKSLSYQGLLHQPK